MRVIIYYADAPGAHPDQPVSMNHRIWPIMVKRIRACGYKLELLTARGSGAGDVLDHDVLHEYDDIDTSLVMLAREKCYAQFMDKLGDEEQVSMIEPDCYLLREIPPLTTGDVAIMRRRGNPIPSCFRIYKGKARGFVHEMLRRVELMDRERQVWYGEIHAQMDILGGQPQLDKNGWAILPSEALGMPLEIRNAHDYCMPKMRSNPDPVAWTFNGTHKATMLRMGA